MVSLNILKEKICTFLSNGDIERLNVIFGTSLLPKSLLPTRIYRQNIKVKIILKLIYLILFFTKNLNINKEIR